MGTLLAALLCPIASLQAKAPGDFRNVEIRAWGAQEGLPEESIYQIAETPDGYIWLATADGLLRFNGQNFKRLSAGKSAGVFDASMRAVISQRDRLWTGGRDFIGHTETDHFGSFTRVNFISTPFPRRFGDRAGVLSLNARPDGGLLVTRADGIFLLSGNMTDGTHVPELLVPSPPGETIRAFHEGRSGRIWIVTETGLKVRSGSGWESISDAPREGATLTEAADGSLWAATRGILYHFKEKRRTILLLESKPREWGGPLQGLLEDKSGNIWVALAGGVGRITNGRLEKLPFHGYVRPDDFIYALHQSADGSIWGGTRWGTLVRIQSRVFSTVDYRDALGDTSTTAVRQDSDGNIWVGTLTDGAYVQRDGRWKRVPGTGFGLYSLTALPNGKMLGRDQGGLWYGDSNGVRSILPLRDPVEAQYTSFSQAYGDHIFFNEASTIYRLPLPIGAKPAPQKVAEVSSVRSILEDKDGLWAVSWDRGLYHLLEGKESLYPIEPESGRRAFSLYPLTPDLLLVGTNTGVYAFDRQARRFLDRPPAFSEHQIFFMQPDNAGTLWLAGRTALLSVPASTLIEYFRGTREVILPLRLSAQQGLSSTNYGLGTSSIGTLTREGEVWLASLGGAIHFRPDDVLRSHASPACAIDDLFADGVPFPLLGVARLPAGTRRIQLHYTVLGRNAGQGPVFRYRLRGESNAWVETYGRQAVYSNLGPGTYTFEVQARVLSQAWPETRESIEIEIAPFWYQQRSVQILGSLALLLLIGGGIRLRILGARRRTEQLEARVRARTAELAFARDEAERSRQRAESANRVKSEFLANMSHELRTPLNGVIGMTEVALQTPLTAAQRELLVIAKTSADSLLTVINDLLDFSKIEAGKAQLDPVPIALQELVEETVKIVAISGHKKGLQFSCELEPDVPQMLLGDSGRLRQILLNLLANAVKFTERGEVAVRVGVDLRTATEAVLHFSVRDTGIGIPEESHKRIFTAFEQADSSTTRRYGGTGLGLAISSRLVRMMSGRLWVESQVGQGSTFHFTARLGVLDGSIGGNLARLAGQIKPVEALVITNSGSNRMLLEETLARWGITATCLPGELDAVRQTLAAPSEGSFVAVLIDEDTLTGAGPELAEALKNYTCAKSTRVVMLTSSVPCDTPATDVPSFVPPPIRVLKPVSVTALQRAVFQALGEVEQLPLPAEAQPADSWRNSVRILLAEDNLVNQHIAVRMLETQGYQVTVVGDGHEAVNAWENQKFDLLLFDVQMPRMDGLEAAAEIRRREPAGTRVPIVALTAGASEDREKCLQAGMDDYLMKPIHFRALLQVLERRIAPKAQHTLSRRAAPES